MKIFKTMTMIAAVCLALTGCTKEQTGEDNAVLTVLKASFGEPVLKAAADVSGKMTWEEGDAIGVLTSSGNLVKFELSDGAGETSATFSARLAEGETVGDFAVYPYAYFSYAEGSLTVNLPKGYDLAAGEKVNYPMLAKIAGDKLSFKHLCGAFRFTVNAVPKAAKRLYFLSNKLAINGSFTVDVSGDIPEIKATSSSTTTTFHFVPEDYGTSMTFDVIVPVGTYDDCSVRFYNLNYSPIGQAKALKSSNKVDRGVMKTMPALSMGIQDSDYEDGSGKTSAIYTVVDNPFKTSVNPSSKVLYSSVIAGTEGNIRIDQSTLSWTMTSTSDFGDLRLLYSICRCKFYCGTDAGKAMPFARLGYGDSYRLPDRVNGSACTAENVSGLLKTDDWNILEWDRVAQVNDFRIRTLCGLDGNETSAPVERKFYFDDFELLP